MPADASTEPRVDQHLKFLRIRCESDAESFSKRLLGASLERTLGLTPMSYVRDGEPPEAMSGQASSSGPSPGDSSCLPGLPACLRLPAWPACCQDDLHLRGNTCSCQQIGLSAGHSACLWAGIGLKKCPSVDIPEEAGLFAAGQ